MDGIIRWYGIWFGVYIGFFAICAFYSRLCGFKEAGMAYNEKEKQHPYMYEYTPVTMIDFESGLVWVDALFLKDWKEYKSPYVRILPLTLERYYGERTASWIRRNAEKFIECLAEADIEERQNLFDEYAYCLENPRYLGVELEDDESLEIENPEEKSSEAAKYHWKAQELNEFGWTEKLECRKYC